MRLGADHAQVEDRVGDARARPVDHLDVLEDAFRRHGIRTRVVDYEHHGGFGFNKWRGTRSKMNTVLSNDYRFGNSKLVRDVSESNWGV